MFVSIPLVALACTLLGLMWASGVWAAVRIDRKERAQEEDRRLLRQVAAVVLGPADADGRRAGGIEDWAREHEREDLHEHERARRYRFAATRKILALDRELQGLPPEPAADEMSETGQFAALTENLESSIPHRPVIAPRPRPLPSILKAHKKDDDSGDE